MRGVRIVTSLCSTAATVGAIRPFGLDKPREAAWFDLAVL
jgi:hypothetical protein